MTIDRNAYFDYVRDVLFEGALSQQQVDGQNVILALWEGDQTGTPMDDVRWLAYMLATTLPRDRLQDVAGHRAGQRGAICRAKTTSPTTVAGMCS